jgi:hypothetical protein
MGELGPGVNLVKNLQQLYIIGITQSKLKLLVIDTIIPTEIGRLLGVLLIKRTIKRNSLLAVNDTGKRIKLR